MAECQCNISNGLLSPGVFNIKQFLNSTEEMRWTVSSRYLTGGIDLANYDAYLVLQHGTSGEPDEVMLSKVVNEDDTITLIWDVGKYATWLKGYVKYQIIFRGRVVYELSVLGASDSKANGVYQVNSEWADGTGRYWMHESYETYKIAFDTVNKRWQLLNGNTVISYQTIPHDEPHYGLWDNLFVCNVSAMAWRSLEAVMYISESIAADELVTAKCPTILRQMWHALRDLVIKSGIVVFEGETKASDWKGSVAPYYVNAGNITDMPNGCTIENVRLFKAKGNGVYSDIANIRYEQDASGVVKVYCLEKVVGKLAITVKGGNGYTFIAKNALDDMSGVTSVNGETGAVQLDASDVGAASARDIAYLQEQIDSIKDDINTAVTELEGI